MILKRMTAFFLNAAVFWSKRQGVFKKRGGVLSVLQVP